MSVSKVKQIVKEEIRKIRLEGAMSELDILMDESRNFEDFVSKIKSNPKFRDIDVASSDVKDFLQTMWDRDNESAVNEVRGFTVRELRLKAIDILKSIGVPLSEENIQDILGGLIAKIKKHNAGSVLAEFVESPINSEVVLMIRELAEGYGVKIPVQIEKGSQKQWNTVSKMAEYAVREMDASNRKSFIKDVMRIKKAINNDEIVI